MPNSYDFDWNDIAFASKKPLKDLRAIFIAAPREMSERRFVQLIKTYLPKGNIVLGFAKEDYVLGLENQAQFKMMQLETVRVLIDKIRRSSSTRQIATLVYNQRDLPYILEKIDFERAVFVNGSWYWALHLRPEYYMLNKRRVPYDKVSPFADEAEAKRFVIKTKLPALPESGLFTDADMMGLARSSASHSYDYASFQTGGALGREKNSQYELVATSHNQIVPYETYAMHFGSQREKNFSPPHDLNHYDTIHFEVALLIETLKRRLDLSSATLFANVLPCPHCARMLAVTDIAELVYAEDHSAGYAVQLLEAAGKKVRRIVPRPEAGV